MNEQIARLSEDLQKTQQILAKAVHRIGVLEAENRSLKNRIGKMVVIDEDFSTPFTLREVVQMLFDWANEDRG